MKNKNIYKPNIKKLKEILSNFQIYGILEQQNLNLLKKTVGIIEIKLKRKEKTTEEEISQIKKALNFLLQTAIEKPITPILKDLIDEFIIFIANWNENLGKEIEIRQKIYTLRRFVDYHLSVIDAIQILKTLAKKTEEIQRFSPPAFELSRHYLNSLQELGNNKKQKRRRK